VELTPPQVVDQTKPLEDAKPSSPTKGEVLPLEGMRWNSFSAYDATERCLALEDFSKTFARQYGDNATIKDWTCSKYFYHRDPTVTVDFQIEHREKQPKLRYWLEIKDSEANLQFSINSTTHGGVDFSPELAAISPKLGNWEASLKDFLKNPNAGLKVYGRPFDEFVDAVIVDLKSQGLSMKAKDGTRHIIKVSLNPGQNRASGTVQFNEVPAPLLSEQPVESAETTPGTIAIGPPSGVLGCRDLACLNDGSVHYVIADEHISIQREIPSTGSVKQIAFTGAKYPNFPESPNP
jgi:hypothetical protein